MWSARGHCKKFLAGELPKRVFQATSGADPRSQLPDARIGSDPETAWLSLIPARRGGSPPQSFAGAPHADAETHSKQAIAAADRSTIATRSMLARDGVPLESLLLSMPVSDFTGRNDLDIFSQQNRQFRETSRFLSRPFGPLHMETRCGFKIRGARIVRCTGANPSSVFDDGTGAHADVPERSACSYLLEFEGGTGALLPAIGGFLASLTFDGQQLVDVAYEPAEGTARWEYSTTMRTTFVLFGPPSPLPPAWAHSGWKAPTRNTSLAACSWQREVIRRWLFMRLTRIAIRGIENESPRWPDSCRTIWVSACLTLPC
ncbi:MAG UNVERIFIED_CONTAM: hypothetical protein LVR18_44650 [Planctomycetaceae bacterium]